MAEEMKKEEHADADAGTTLDKVLSALRYEFGGHEEKAATRKGGA